jgi:hypothetical protein
MKGNSAMLNPSFPGGTILRGALATLVVGFGVSAGGIVPALHAGAHASANGNLSSPCIPAGHGPGAIPSIAFGRTGGNIRPLTVNLYGDGTVAYKGAVAPASGYTVRPDAVLGLKRLAGAEGFSTWPRVITSSKLFPDSASLFITIRAGCETTTKTVIMRPGANQPGFQELWDTFSAAAGLGNR